jgi:hypothetical protein
MSLVEDSGDQEVNLKNLTCMVIISSYFIHIKAFLSLGLDGAIVKCYKIFHTSNHKKT